MRAVLKLQTNSHGQYASKQVSDTQTLKCQLAHGVNKIWVESVQKAGQAFCKTSQRTSLLFSSRATSGKLLRDKMERTWAFLSA